MLQGLRHRTRQPLDRDEQDERRAQQPRREGEAGHGDQPGHDRLLRPTQDPASMPAAAPVAMAIPGAMPARPSATVAPTTAAAAAGLEHRRGTSIPMNRVAPTSARCGMGGSTGPSSSPVPTDADHTASSTNPIQPQ